MGIYDFIVLDNMGNEVALSEYEGKVLLIVNTATGCGFTPQYTALEALYKKYRDRGFEILDFPCNQFFGQAPGSDAEIQTFCALNYGTTFPRFTKVDVNGEHAAPLYTWLKEQAIEQPDDELPGLLDRLAQKGQQLMGNSIKWNFTKFLVDKSGNVTGRYAPTRKPETLEAEIERLLAP